MWLHIPDIYNGTSPHKQLQVLGPELHAHSPRRRSESFANGHGNYVRWEGPHVAPMATITGHTMPPPPLPINGDRSQGQAWDPTTMGAVQDPFLDPHSRRNGVRGSNDSDVSMPDYIGTPRSQPPPYHELPDMSNRVIGLRRPRAPTILPNNDPAFDDLVRMMDSPHRIMPLPAPGLMPPTNTRVNSASNSPPAPPNFMPDGRPQTAIGSDRPRIFSAGNPQIGSFFSRVGMPRHDSDVTMRSVPRGSDSVDAEPLHLQRTTAPPNRSVGGINGRENGAHVHDYAGNATAEEGPTAVRSTSSGTLRASTTPKDTAAPTPALAPVATSGERKGSGEVKRKRATPRKRGEGPSPRKISRTEESRDVAAVAEPARADEDEMGKGEMRVASEGIARSRGRRSATTAIESPLSEGLAS